jgi:hypothetical protein
MMALLLGADSRAKAPKRIAAMRALAALPDAVRQALQLDGTMQKLAEQLKDSQSLIFFGRGYNYSTGLEAALKARAARRGVSVRGGGAMAGREPGRPGGGAASVRPPRWVAVVSARRCAHSHTPPKPPAFKPQPPSRSRRWR